MPVIYVDVLLILNLWVDFLLLTLTARICRYPVRRWRVVCGAAVGALLCLLLFLPPLNTVLTLLIRFLGTVVLVLLTFGTPRLRVFFKLFLTFAVVSALFGGLATALWYFLAPAGFMVIRGVVYYDAPASLLIVFTAVSYVVILVYERLRRTVAPKNRTYTLTVRDGGRDIVCSLLYDSGCTLREPFSGKPALVIDRTAAARLLPRDFTEDTALARDKRFRLIPFETVGGEGVLPAFCPAFMQIRDRQGNAWDISGSYLAISEKLQNSEYAALCGTDIGDLLEGR